jgi:hypothetical protein
VPEKAPARVDTPAPAPAPPSTRADTAAADTTPADVIRRYYSAIDAKRYDEAYRLWSQKGAASGKTSAAFAAGFKDTQHARVTVGDSTSLEGAAGSQFATIPVTVDATLVGGKAQRFTGTYTLRRSMVDGATAEQRTWHIYTAELSPLGLR